MQRHSKSFEKYTMHTQFECMEIVTVIFFFLILLFWYWYNNRTSQVFTNWPLIGMVPGLLKCRQCFMEETTSALLRIGDTAEFKGPCFSNFNFIVTSNPLNMNHILCKRFENYDKSPEFREIFFDALGDGIFNAAADSWKGQRKVLMALMHSSKFVRRAVKNISQKLDQSLLPLFEHFSKVDAEFDLQDVFQRFTYDNTCTLVFGVDPNSLSIDFPHVASKEAFNEAEEVLLYRHMVPMSLWKLQKWLRIGEEKKMMNALEIVDDFVYKCISSKRERLRNKSQADDEEDEEFHLSTALMDDKEDEGSDIGKSDKFLRDVVINVLAAGKDTVTATFSWFFWFVATNPSIEGKILEEIKANPPNKTMIYGGEEYLGKFIYLHAALCETLRLYPGVPFNHKVASQSDILPTGHRIAKNTRILLDYYAMGRMKEIWGEDCLEFKPERWISKQGDILHVPSYKFTAFNAGPRTCIGKDLSFMQMKMTAISILQNYELEVVNGCSRPSPSNAIVCCMKNGLKVKVKKRVAKEIS